MRSFCSPESFANSVCQRLRLPRSASSRFSNTVWPGKMVGFWNLRPIPARAISCSLIWVRSSRLP